jgi:WD40 repeat protein
LKEVYAGIEAADTFICVLSPYSIASVICAREVEHAVTCKKRLIPIVVRDVDHTLVNPVLASLNWIFFREYDDLADSFNKLVGALDTNLEYFHAGSRLLVRAREWEGRGHNASFTLRGSDLNEAERWLVKGTEQKQGPTALQVEYITASRRVANTRQRIALSAVSVGLVVTLILSLISFFQFQSAQTEAHIAQSNAATAIAERNVAQSHALAANADVFSAQSQVDLALLLSKQAYQTNNNFESRDSLLSALEFPHMVTILRGSVGSSQRVVSLAFSPDGTTLASVYENFGNPTVEDGVSSDPVLKDGKLVGSISSAPDHPYSGISMWNMKIRQPHDLLLPTLLEQNQEHYGVFSVAFNPDGKSFASVGFGGVWLWDARTGAPLAQYPLGTTSPNFLSNLVFSKDGRFLVAEGCVGDNTCAPLQVLVWDVATRKLVSSLLPDVVDNVFVHISNIALSPDGKLLVLGGCESRHCLSLGPDYFILWDINAGKFVGTPMLNSPTKSGIQDVQFSPDGKLLAVANAAGAITIWNAASRTLIATLSGHVGPVGALAFNPDGSILASGGADKTVRLWDVAKKALMYAPFTGQQDAIRSLAWSSNRQLVSGGESGSIILWSTGSAIPVGQIVQDKNVFSVAYSADGRYFASGQTDGTIVLRKRDTLAFFGILTKPFSQSPVTALAFSPKGDKLVSGFENGSLILWDVQNMKMIGFLPSPGSAFEHVAFSPDGSVVAGSQGAPNQSYNISGIEITLWDVEKRTFITHFTSLTDPLSGKTYTPSQSWAFSQDGRTLVLLVFDQVDAKNHDSALLLWDIEARKSAGPSFASSGSKDPYEDMSLSSDGHTIAVINNRGIVTLWDSGTKNLLRQFTVNDGSDVYQRIAFSPNGKVLAVDGLQTDFLQESISLWDISTNSLLAHPFQYLQLGTDGIAFDPDGQSLVNISYLFGFGHIVFLDISIENWESRVCAIANRNLTVGEWQRFVGNEPYRKICPQLPVPESVIKDMLVQAAQWAVETSNPIVNNYVCWYGSTDQFAKEVMPACERAVALEPDNGIYRDSEGLARALSGDTQGAIGNFKFFVTWAAENNLYQDKPYITERNTWISKLQTGANPFDARTLSVLQSE